MNDFFAAEHIRNHIHFVRGHRVLMHTALARIYRVPMNRLIAHAQHFPGDYCFRLERWEGLTFIEESADDRHRPYAFTEHGALAMAYVLGTPQTIATSVRIVRAFVQLRQTAMSYDALSADVSMSPK